MSNCCCDHFNSIRGHRVIIHSCRARYLVVVTDICPTYITAIEVGNGCTKIINIDSIDFIEDLSC